ncbi:Rft-1-domain-containing protein [Mycena floridula]|nr:Rft-1-domain-containing protein [Mycena floridula]
MANHFMSSLAPLISLQLLSRMVTFGLNQALLRMVSRRVYGTAAIQFELVLSTILVLSREGVRGSVLRVGRHDNSSAKQKGTYNIEMLLNVSTLPFLFGIPLSLVTLTLYVGWLTTAETSTQPYFLVSVSIYALSALIELAGEGGFNRSMTFLETHVRVRAEGLGVMVKTVVTFLVLLYDTRSHTETSLALLSFAAGQLTYATTVLGMYTWYYGPPRVWPKHMDPSLLTLSMTLTLQSVIKHLLTEGDKLILSWYSSLEDQSGYALAVNYGSLIARIIFQPIEETLRVYFSRTKDAAARASTLCTVLTLQTTLSILLVVFGPPYLDLLLFAALPRKYLASNAPSILAAWIYYIPILAINGGMEAFLTSVMQSDDVNKWTGSLTLFAPIFPTSAIVLYRFGFGDVALVWANMLNLGARILYAGIWPLPSEEVLEKKKADGEDHLRRRKKSLKQPKLEAGPGSSISWLPKFPPLFLILFSLICMGLTRRSANRVIDVFSKDERLAKLNLLTSRPILNHLALGVCLAFGWLGIWWFQVGRQAIKRR